MSEPDILLTPPDAAEAAVLARGIVSAAEGPGGLTPLQDLLIRATFHSMTGHEVDPAACAPISPGDFAAALGRRNEIFRTRIVQVMLLAALVVRPLPGQVATRLRRVPGGAARAICRWCRCRRRRSRGWSACIPRSRTCCR